MTAKRTRRTRAKRTKRRTRRPPPPAAPSGAGTAVSVQPVVNIQMPSSFPVEQLAALYAPLGGGGGAGLGSTYVPHTADFANLNAQAGGGANLRETVMREPALAAAPTLGEFTESAIRTEVPDIQVKAEPKAKAKPKSRARPKIKYEPRPVDLAPLHAEIRGLYQSVAEAKEGHDTRLEEIARAFDQSQENLEYVHEEVMRRGLENRTTLEALEGLLSRPYLEPEHIQQQLAETQGQLGWVRGLQEQLMQNFHARPDATLGLGVISDDVSGLRATVEQLRDVIHAPLSSGTHFEPARAALPPPTPPPPAPEYLTPPAPALPAASEPPARQAPARQAPARAQRPVMMLANEPFVPVTGVKRERDPLEETPETGAAAASDSLPFALGDGGNARPSLAEEARNPPPPPPRTNLLPNRGRGFDVRMHRDDFEKLSEVEKAEYFINLRTYTEQHYGEPDQVHDGTTFLNQHQIFKNYWDNKSDLPRVVRKQVKNVWKAFNKARNRPMQNDARKKSRTSAPSSSST